MNNKGFKLLALGALPILLSSLAGCGGSAPSGAINVRFWHTFGAKNKEALETKASQFSALVKKNLGVDVTVTCEYQGGYDDVLKKVTQGWGAGDIPTIAIAYPDHVADYLSVEDGKYVYNLENYFDDAEIGFGKQAFLGDKAAYGKSDFVHAFLDEGTHFAKQGTYTLPYMKSSEIMFYNLDAVEKAMPYYHPEITSTDQIKEFIGEMSWAQLMELCDVIRAHKDEVLPTMEEPLYYDSDGNFFITQLYQNNIAYSSINAAGQGVIDFESGDARTKAEAMMTALKAEYDKGNIRTKGTEGTYGSDSFKNEKCVFTVGSTGGTGYNFPEGDAFRYAAAELPFVAKAHKAYVSQGPTLTFLGNPKLSQEENDKRMKYGFMFAKYLTNPDVNVEVCIYGSEGYLPVRESAYTTDEFLEFLQDGEIYADAARVMINDIDGAYINTPVFKGSAELRTQSGAILTQAFVGTKTVTQAFDDAIEAAKKKM